MIDENGEENNYKEVDLKDLPSRGVFYKEDTFIHIRAFSMYEIKAMNEIITKDNFMKQLEKLEFSLFGVKTNMDSLDFCYTDVYYLFYAMYALTYKEINVNHEDKTVVCPLDPKDFFYTNEDFSKKEDLYYEKENLTFYLPSLYNMAQANSNIIKSAVQGAFSNGNESMTERMALVPYLQKNKISDGALEFVNEHMMSFSTKDIKDMRTFINSKENLVLGQKTTIIHEGEPLEILIALSQLI